MIELPRRETKRLVAVHGWSGIVLGLLLYAVVLTGMVAVFAHELGEWSTGTTEMRSPFDTPIDATVKRLAAATPARYRDDVSLYATPTHALGVFFHTHDTVDGESVERGIAWQVDRAGKVVSRREGLGEDVFGPDNDNAFGNFLVDLHVRLHLPNPWGLLLTGILGLAMLVAAISGVLIHRHLFKDIFTLRRNAAPGLVTRDRHNVAGTWSLPFAFILAFTGSFFSFAGSFGLPALAMVAFGGNQQVMLETLYGAAPEVDARPSSPASLDAILGDSTRRAGIVPNFISIAHYGRADAAVTMFHEAREGDLASTAFVYSGATGAFRNQKPLVGAQPSMGGSLYALVGPLHFGNFAGIVSKAVWFGLGFATCYVVLTGMQLWLRRREAGSPALDRLDRAVNVVGFGLPFGLAASAIGFFVTRPAGDAVTWTPGAFLIASGMAILLGLVLRDAARVGALLRLATGATLIVLPAVRIAMGGPGWGEALASGQSLLVAVDLGVAFAGAAFLYSLRGAPRPAAARAPVLQAAE